MKADRSLGSYLRYGRTLAGSGVTGLRRGGESYLQGQPLSEAMTPSLRASAVMAALGACASLLPLYLKRSRPRIPAAVASGIVGSAIGFVAGLTWMNRELTASMTRSALKQISLVRDEHWLERHPIDYA